MNGINRLIKSKEDVETILNVLTLSGKVDKIEMGEGYSYIAEIEPQVLLIHIPDNIEKAVFTEFVYTFKIRYYSSGIKHFYITGLRNVTHLSELFYQLNNLVKVQKGAVFDFSYANVENLRSIVLKHLKCREIIFGEAVVHNGFYIECGCSNDLYIEHPKVNGRADLVATAEGMSTYSRLEGVSTLNLRNIEAEDDDIVQIFKQTCKNQSEKVIDVLCPSGKMIRFSAGETLIFTEI